MAKPQIPDPDYSRRQLYVYTGGFILSVILTLTAFMVVRDKLVYGWALILVLIALALIQLAVQLLFFLHLGDETKPRINLQAFLFMALVVLILAVGSLWIMSNQSNNTMTPAQTEEYLLEDEGFKQ